eukprot:TRINITY_DN538_c0_g1_i1.p1 TRINITY_DN538_c0_g1~~TRINITY_DN538_c0_g1_i1.p1  ORF type:complete len:320 (+),score=51.27 TRINITY_DN538_c0_g1_i1:25-984(+)
MADTHLRRWGSFQPRNLAIAHNNQYQPYRSLSITRLRSAVQQAKRRRDDGGAVLAQSALEAAMEYFKAEHQAIVIRDRICSALVLNDMAAAQKARLIQEASKAMKQAITKVDDICRTYNATVKKAEWRLPLSPEGQAQEENGEEMAAASGSEDHEPIVHDAERDENEPQDEDDSPTPPQHTPQQPMCPHTPQPPTPPVAAQPAPQLGQAELQSALLELQRRRQGVPPPKRSEKKLPDWAKAVLPHIEGNTRTGQFPVFLVLQQIGHRVATTAEVRRITKRVKKSWKANRGKGEMHMAGKHVYAILRAINRVMGPPPVEH